MTDVEGDGAENYIMPSATDQGAFAMHDPSPSRQDLGLPVSFDSVLGRRIIEVHRWAVREGLNGASAHDLFDGICRLLVADGVPLWRCSVAMRTLHPQWSGYGYVWRRDLNALQPDQWAHGTETGPIWQQSPFRHLVDRAENGERNPSLRRQLFAGPQACDFPVLHDLLAAGATDYFSQLFVFAEGDPAQGSGLVYSFATDQPGGFDDDDLMLLQASLPVLSLALKAHAGYVIAAALLQTYLGSDAGRRVHAGAIERGSVESIRAVLWYADIRGFTAIADAAPALLIDLLDQVFEVLTESLRRRGAQVLKFLGDGMLATFPVDGSNTANTCRMALDAAAEAMRGIAALNTARAAQGKPVAPVDLALHLGEVLYGNVGAVDRLDFTVIGPAVNEVARIEALCEPLNRNVLVSAELAAASGASGELLRSLGYHTLRGVRDARQIYELVIDPQPWGAQRTS
jgi:adenylate cyclase